MRIFKWTGIAVAALLGLTLIAAIVVVITFDPNDYKPQITALLEERTGRSVRIDDTIEWSLFPWLAIETGGISVGNHPDFDTGPFATVDSLSARVRVWPLLRRQVELGQITLDGLILDVGTNAAGMANWSDLVAPDAPTGTAADSAPTGGNRLAALEIAGVRVLNGRILWRERGEVRYVVSDVGLTTGPIALDRPVDVTAALAVLDVASQRRVELDLTASAALDGDEISIAGLELSTTLVDPNGRARATATIVTEMLAVTGGERLRAAAGSMEATANDPPFGAEQLDLSVRWPAIELDAGAGTAHVDDVTTTVNGIVATWTLDLEDLGGSPTVRGEVNVPAVPAGRLLTTAGIAAPTGIEPDELGELAGRGSFVATGGGESISGDFTIDVLGMSIRTRGTMSDSMAELSLSIPRFTPTAAFGSLLADYLPAGANVDAIESLSADGTTTVALATLEHIVVRDLSVGVNDASLSGHATADLADGEPTRVVGEAEARFPDPLLLEALLGDTFPENMSADAIGRAALTASFDYAGTGDTLSVAAFSLAAFGLDSSGRMTINSLRGAPVVRGRGTIARFDPRAVLERLDQPVPATSDPAAFRAAAFNGDFVIDSAHADFRDMTLTLDDMQIAGTISVEDFESPRFRFDLATDAIDVDRYLPPPTEDAADGERAAGDIELASEPLERLDLTGTARVGTLKLANLDFQRVETTLAIANGRATIEPARTALYGGTFDGALTVDTTGDAPTMRLAGQAASVALAPLITALTGESNVRGTGSFDLDLTGTGGTVTETLQTAAGTMSFALNAGAIDGFNLGRTLCAAYNLRERLPQPAAAPAATEFQLIRASADVRNGIATTRDLLGQTAFLDLTGSGGMNLADARIDYTMAATLTAAVPISGCETMTEFVGDSIPFTIKGPLDSPSIEPDYREIVRRRVQDDVRERVEDRLRDRLRDLL